MKNCSKKHIKHIIYKLSRTNPFSTTLSSTVQHLGKAAHISCASGSLATVGIRYKDVSRICLKFVPEPEED